MMAVTTNETPLSKTEESPGRLIKNLDQSGGSGSNKLLYAGFAAPGAADASAVWQIQKVTYDGNDNIATVRYADGNVAFDNVWDDRASLSYS